MVNTGALLERLNYAIAVASNRIPGTRVDLKPYASADRSQILNKAVDQILNGEISPVTKATLLKQIQQPLPEVKAAGEADNTEMLATNMREGQQEPADARPAYWILQAIQRFSR